MSVNADFDAASLQVREVFGAAWALFQVSLLTCLPLAVLGVAASGVPGAEAAKLGEARGFLHSGQWWGVYAASSALMLICYGAVLRQQLSLAGGERPLVMSSLRRGALGLPATVLLVVLSILPLVPGAVWLGVAGSGWVALALLAGGAVAMLPAFCAWPLLIAENLTPWSALRRSAALVLARGREVAAVVGALVGAVLVFVLLTGILMAVVMNLAGPEAQTSHVGLSASRWLMAAVLSLPVVFAGAVSVVTYRAVTRAGQPE